MKPSELIRQYGWVQGWYGSYDDGFCILGAIGTGIGDLEGKSHEVVEKLTKTVCAPLNTWNDAPGRTKDEVLALLEAEGL
jgi:hypothetical protein